MCRGFSSPARSSFGSGLPAPPGSSARSAAAPRAAVKRWGVTAGTSRASTFVLVLGLAATLLASRAHPTDALFADTAGVGDNGFATATQFEP